MNTNWLSAELLEQLDAAGLTVCRKADVERWVEQDKALADLVINTLRASSETRRRRMAAPTPSAPSETDIAAAKKTAKRFGLVRGGK